MIIDIKLNFADETKGFWEHFWNCNRTLPNSGPDPDSTCKLLRLYHQTLWSRELPNGQVMNLQCSKAMSEYLTWNGMRFGSDSITASFRYARNKEIIEKVKNSLDNYDVWLYEYLKHTYTIGGMIIFPKHKNSINQCRGTNPFIKDRWDLTLECIRLYYNGIINRNENPLGWCLMQDEQFFKLFVNFKGYIDFFFLNDCVTSDYEQVKFWIPTNNFYNNPLPKSVEEYFAWIENIKDFVTNRNLRIQKFMKSIQEGVISADQY